MSIKKFCNQCLWFSIVILILSGCASTQTYKTIGFVSSSKPVTEQQIKIFERGESITDNFQILGKVTVNCNTGISKGNAIKKMKAIAFQNDSDGIIDIHRGPGCAWRIDAGVHYNGLMVKWLPPDIPSKKLEKNFLVSRFPMMNPKSIEKTLVLKNEWGYGVPLMDFPWVNTLVFKGYYVLPEYTGDGSSLSEKAQLLIKVETVSKSGSIAPLSTLAYGLTWDYDAKVIVKLIDKESGTILEEKHTKGEKFQHWLSMIVESGSDLAMGDAINEAVKDLPNIE